MSTPIIDSLHYNKFPELKQYFDSEVFNSIPISIANPEKIMMDAGYVSNVTIKFWRLLQVRKLLNGNEVNFDYCGFLLDVFLNQALSCTDTLATCLNHFLKMELKNHELAIQNDDFLNKLKQILSPFTEINTLDIQLYHDWVKTKLFPFRNIVTHMGEPSAGFETDIDENFHFTIKCYVTLKETEWDFVQMRKDLKDYPSHNALQITTNSINVPNILTGSTGDTHKYVRIDAFFDDWIDKIYNLIKKHIEWLNIKMNPTPTI